jgi:aspartate aminotransferase
MKIRVSDAVSRIAPSLTLVLTAKAAELKKRGVDVCAFTAGEPDFDTPDTIRRATCDALMKGGQICQYTPAAGLPDLRSAIAQRFIRDNGVKYDPADIIVSVGAKQVLANAIFALVNPGDEVLICSPFWLSYPEMVAAAGGRSVFVDCSGTHNNAPTAAAIKAAITPRTRAIILNSPNNPTGGVFDRAQIEAIAAALVGTNIVIVSDEMYEYFLYDGAVHVSPAAVSADAYARTLTISGLSKSHAMTGWRIGFAGGPGELIRAMVNLQSHTTSNAATVSQYAAMFALAEGKTFANKVRGIFEERRTAMVGALQAIPGLECAQPRGAFYAWAKVSGLYRPGMATSIQFCEQLLEKEAVAAVPGSVFGNDEYVRFSYAASMETIKKGTERMARFVAGLK